MNSNELLLWLVFFHLRNKKLIECNKYVYSREEIRQIFMLEYTKQQKFIMPNISNKV